MQLIDIKSVYIKKVNTNVRKYNYLKIIEYTLVQYYCIM